MLRLGILFGRGDSVGTLVTAARTQVHVVVCPFH